MSGTLPHLVPGDPPDLPAEATEYESTVDSSQNNITLHKAASWTNTALTEGEIRIDYGQAAEYNRKIDFIFVLDYSSSMLDTVQTTAPGGEASIYPRSFLTDDVVYGASKILLDQSPQGYDNRVAMVAFGSDDDPLWTSGFTNSADDVENTLFTHPLTVANNTNYSAGLQGAIDLISSREDSGRTPAVIFLSDGAPTNGAGTAQAQTLRNMGVRVYPVSIFTPPTNALRAISHDGQTAYNAEDTGTLETIIPEIAEEIITLPKDLDVVLRDVLSSYFTLATGSLADITVSQGGGSVTITGDTLDWDLIGSAPGVDHSIRIRVCRRYRARSKRRTADKCLAGRSRGECVHQCAASAGAVSGPLCFHERHLPGRPPAT